MFTSATIYRIQSDVEPTDDATESLESLAFVPCAATQAKSIGWVPPRGHANGALVEFVAGQHILKLMTETKTVPADVVQRKLDEKIAEIEQITGRKPGKKERRELKEDVVLSLLPMAFPKRSAVFVWIDIDNKLLVVDSASQARCDDVVSMLVRTFDGLQLRMINTKTEPAAAMALWLTEKEAPEHFTIDRECELKATDESKAVVKYGRHPLDIDGVGEHIRQGKMPTKLALTWDDRVSFVLTEGGTLKKIEMLDAAILGDKGMTLENDAFDADVTIATGELSVMIKDLIGTLGGEVVAA